VPVGLVAELLARRARRAGGRWALVAVAVALAGTPLVVSPAVGATTSADALRRGVAQLPAGERSVIASWSGLPDAAQQARVDAAARAALARLGDRPVRRQILVNALADRTGRTFRLAVTDDLPGVTRLVEGRLPAACAPDRCEVVELAGPAQGSGAAQGSGQGSAQGASAAGLVPDPALHLVVVGRVVRTDPLLLSGTFDPGAAAPVLLAGDAARFRMPAPLVAFGRAYGWVAPWDPDRVLALGVDGWIGRAARAGEQLAAAAPGAVLTAPDTVLREQDERARLSAGRLGLLAAAGCAVLLGAAVLGGTALRRDHEGFADALRLRGAGAGVVAVLLVAEAALAALAGAVGALVLGGGAALALAAGAGLPPWPTAASALVAALPTLAAVTVAATGVVVAAIGWRAPGGSPEQAPGLLHALEAGAAGCLGAAVLLASRGGVGTGDRSDPLLTALPLLVLTAAGLLVARCWPPLARLLAHLPPRTALGARLGLAAVAGRPARPAATAGVLAAAVATAVFAAGYAATLDRGAGDQAAHAVPLDLRITPGAPPVAPLDAVPPADLAAALPGATVSPVIRTAGSVRLGAQQADAVQLVGVDPAVLPRIARWSAQAGSGADPAALARALGAGTPPRAVLPAGSRLALAVSGPVGVVVTGYVRDVADGRERAVDLLPDAAGHLTGTLPALRDAAGAPAGLRLVALTLALPQNEADRRQHALGEGSTGRAAPAGTLALGAVTVDGMPVAAPWAGWTSAGGGASLDPGATGDPGAPGGAGGPGLRVAYQLGDGQAVLVAPRPSGPVPVLTDPATAALAGGGTVTLLVDGLPFEARPIAALQGFATVDGRFAVLPAVALADLIDRTQPGTASPAEVWVAGVAGRPVPPALAAVSVQARDDVERSLRTDPVAAAATRLLLAGAGIALGVALAAVVLLLVAGRADDAPVHLSWEADGVPPSRLRAALWWGAVVTVVPGALAGTVTGLALTASATRLVAVTAAATVPQPPLQARWWDPGVLGGVAAGAAVLLGLAALIAARSLREPLPPRVQGRPG